MVWRRVARVQDNKGRVVFAEVFVPELDEDGNKVFNYVKNSDGDYITDTDGNKLVEPAYVYADASMRNRAFEQRLKRIFFEHPFPVAPPPDAELQGDIRFGLVLYTHNYKNYYVPDLNNAYLMLEPDIIGDWLYPNFFFTKIIPDRGVGHRRYTTTFEGLYNETLFTELPIPGAPPLADGRPATFWTYFARPNPENLREDITHYFNNGFWHDMPELMGNSLIPNNPGQASAQYMQHGDLLVLSPPPGGGNLESILLHLFGDPLLRTSLAQARDPNGQFLLTFYAQPRLLNFRATLLYPLADGTPFEMVPLSMMTTTYFEYSFSSRAPLIRALAKGEPITDIDFI
jgi:hypothetical protein